MVLRASPVHPSTWVILALASAKLLLHVVVLSPYGYFRDELYYLACANHLALGYVDHPPFSVAVLAAWRAVFGDSVVSIRLVPALAGTALVYVTGRLAVTLGGGTLAAGLACLAVLCAPALVGTDHLYSINALDHLFWAVAALCVVRALDGQARSRWLTLGVVLGLGLLNKASMLWFGAGLAVTLVLTARGRAAIRTAGPFLAAAIALLVFLPHVVWQMRHGWPTAEFAKNAMEMKYVPLPALTFLRESTLAMNPLALPLTVAGVVSPLSIKHEKARPLSIVFVVALGIILSAKAGKPEYLDAAYPLVFASGAVALEPFVSRARKLRVLAATTVASMLVFFALTLPFALPVLSEESFIAYAKWLGVAPHSSEKKELAELPQHYADMHGWEELVRGAEQAWNTLSPDERAHAKVWAVTGGYGPAAAIDVLGSAHGLPHSISTHNTYWLWGFGEESGGPVVLLGGPRDRLEEAFESVTPVGTVECRYCMPYENHKPIYIGRGLKRSWASLWPTLKHYE